MVLRRWAVYCSDDVLWEDNLTREDADLSVDEADESCPCGGKHEAREMPVENPPAPPD